MQINVGQLRVIMSGSVIAEVGEDVRVVADDGTILELKWDRDDENSGTGGTDDMRRLTGSFSSKPLDRPFTYGWGVGNTELGQMTSVRVTEGATQGHTRTLTFTVVANF